MWTPYVGNTRIGEIETAACNTANRTRVCMATCPIPSRGMRRESLLAFCYDATVPVRLGEYGECRRPTSHGPVDLLGEKSPLSDRRIKARQNRDSLKFEDGGRRQPPVLLIPLYLSSARKWDFVSVPATFSPSHIRTQSPVVFFAIFAASLEVFRARASAVAAILLHPWGPLPPSQPVC